MTTRSIAQSAILCLFLALPSPAQNYPDQHFTLGSDSLSGNLESSDGLTLNDDGRAIMLRQDRTDGYAIVRQQNAGYPFNQGLPSWNGSAPDTGSSFKIQMRFPDGTGWSPWLTVGYWKAHIWASYGPTSYAGGYVDIDYVKLSSYVSAWQFKITLTRSTVERPSPTLRTLSFFVSDSRTTTSLDFSRILNDKPAAIFIPTEFIYQYGVDPQIGGEICSPTSVSMILRSYSIPVDPLQFALDTYDPYHGMFGVWPRVVQNASEYGIDGAVTRYRSWSEAREILANGGRISMSVGPPLYTGHLMMLAGFTENGDPIVHDPARTNGYSYVFNKSDLSHSWFDKGGVAYTLYQTGTTPAGVEQPQKGNVFTEGFHLNQNYPNPFNPATIMTYQLPVACAVQLTVYDVLGRQVAVLVNEPKAPGNFEVRFDGTGLANGVYLCRLTAGNYVESRKMILSK